jgi:UBA/TS-N domain
MVLDSSASMVLIPRVAPPAAGIGAVGAGRQQQNMPYFDVPTPPLQLSPPPDEESIQQLTILGFERDTVIRALRQSHNNIERAADWLLSGNGN